MQTENGINGPEIGEKTKPVTEKQLARIKKAVEQLQSKAIGLTTSIASSQEEGMEEWIPKAMLVKAKQCQAKVDNSIRMAENWVFGGV